MCINSFLNFINTALNFQFCIEQVDVDLEDLGIDSIMFVQMRGTVLSNEGVAPAVAKPPWTRGDGEQYCPQLREDRPCRSRFRHPTPRALGVRQC